MIRVGNDTTILPTVSGYLGGEYRFARSWLLGFVGTFTYGWPGYYSAVGSVEISFMTY